MECFDHDEMDAIWGEEFMSCVSPQYSFSASVEMMNILSITPVAKQANLVDYHRQLIPRTQEVMILNDHDPPTSPKQVNALFPSKGMEQSVTKTYRCRGSKNTSNDKKRLSQPRKKKTRTRPPAQVYEHILAERRRREQLGQLFIALSAIVPGLKKTDKTSILGEAINYLKHLEQKARNLEEAISWKGAMQPGVFVKKSQVLVEDQGSSDERSREAEMEVRVVKKNILIRVHCEKEKGVLSNLLREVESMNMVVVNTNVSLVGNSALQIIIIAEMEKGLISLTVTEVATALRVAFKRPTTA